MRLAELMGTLSLATDVGMGMPLEHGLRAAILAVRLGAAAGASDAECADAYYLSFLRWAGCTADSDLAAEVFGDEVAVRGELYGVDWGAPTELMPRLARAIGKGKRPLAAAGAVARTLVAMPRLFDTGRSHCEVGARLARAIGFDDGFRAALVQTFERWDGRGMPDKRRGEDIALPMRIAQVAEELEHGHRAGGVDGARAIARKRSGRSCDPRLVACFERDADAIAGALDVASPWTAALDAEPGTPRVIDDAQIDDVLRAMGRFADLKSRFTRAHSAGVAALARRAADHLRLDDAVARTVERAALVHDLGRVAVGAAIWDKPGPLTDLERERVRVHAYAGERILSRAPCLAAIADVATLAHERLDGRGYHRRLSAAACSIGARVLAAADVYHAMTEPRAHRPAHAPEVAAAELTAQARAGTLCPDAVGAVLAVIGHAPARAARPAGLTERELDVLRLVARGLTNKEVASALEISPRTAGHHLERVFAKVGVTTRAAAAMFAMEHGLVATQPT